MFSHLPFREHGTVGFLWIGSCAFLHSEECLSRSPRSPLNSVKTDVKQCRNKIRFPCFQVADAKMTLCAQVVVLLILSGHFQQNLGLEVFVIQLLDSLRHCLAELLHQVMVVVPFPVTMMGSNPPISMFDVTANPAIYGTCTFLNLFFIPCPTSLFSQCSSGIFLRSYIQCQSGLKTVHPWCVCGS